MTKYQEYLNIIRLISKEVSGQLTREEDRNLSDWIEAHPENRALYSRIKNAENFKLRNIELKEVDVQSGWQMLNSRIERQSKMIHYRKVFMYAATILLPILIIGTSLYLTRQNPKTNFNVLTSSILPGKNRAILVLDDGKSIVLDSANQMEIAEKNGMLIEKSALSLNYTKRTGKETNAKIYNTINIPHGGEYQLVLADGTHVFLNSESQLRYPVNFSGDIREVELTGEAYFDVAKNAHNPFVIKTKGLKIEVLGTSFNLNAYGNTGKVITTLVEGSVRINVPGTNTLLLMPDEQASFDVKNGQIEIRKVDVTLYTSWKDGHFTFFNNRLEDIMETLTRWYSVDVIFENPSVKELRFSGSIERYGDINQILEIIKSTEKVKINIKENTIFFGE